LIYAKIEHVIFKGNVNLVDPTPLIVAGYPDNRLIYPNPNNQKFRNNITSGGVPQAGATSI
jgi:hypothetical protein